MRNNDIHENKKMMTDVDLPSENTSGLVRNEMDIVPR